MIKVKVAFLYILPGPNVLTWNAITASTRERHATRIVSDCKSAWSLHMPHICCFPIVARIIYKSLFFNPQAKVASEASMKVLHPPRATTHAVQEYFIKKVNLHKYEPNDKRFISSACLSELSWFLISSKFKQAIRPSGWRWDVDLSQIVTQLSWRPPWLGTVFKDQERNKKFLSSRSPTLVFW